MSKTEAEEMGGAKSRRKRFLPSVRILSRPCAQCTSEYCNGDQQCGRIIKQFLIRLPKQHSIQLPRVIEGGVWINDSREFGFHSSAALAAGGGGVHSRVKWCEPHFALL